MPPKKHLIKLGTVEVEEKIARVILATARYVGVSTEDMLASIVYTWFNATEPVKALYRDRHGNGGPDCRVGDITAALAREDRKPRTERAETWAKKDVWREGGV